MKLARELRRLVTVDREIDRERPRVLAYCASNIGLGPYFRLMRVLEEIRRRRPEASLLLATDARDASAADKAGVATLKLPGFEFIDPTTGKERPQHLKIAGRELRGLRAELIRTAGLEFAPDLLLMDCNPHGKRDEVLPLLKSLKGGMASLKASATNRSGTKVVLMMRDIPSPPGEEFKLTGDAQAIRRQAAYYDRILIAGQRELFDAAREYQWPEDVVERARHIGFVLPAQAKTSQGHARTELWARYPQLKTDVPTIMASFGGGWHAGALGRALMEGVEGWRRGAQKGLQLILVIGPAASREEESALSAQARALGGIVIERFIADFSRLIAGADIAILQAGSTIYQVLETDVPMILITRDFHSREQHERARRLSRFDGVRVLEEAEPDANAWETALEWAVKAERRQRTTGFSYDGAQRGAEAALELLA